jgi:hypothetical protein
MKVRLGIDPDNLYDTGWGVIFAGDIPPWVREALRPLLDLRQQQTGPLYKDLQYRPGSSVQEFLVGHGVVSVMPEPEKVPYYLLIVGDLEAIPYDFQAQLAVQYAVGRIWFDRPQDLTQYALQVVAFEGSGWEREPRAVFFGPRHPEDLHTQLTTDTLVQPLAERLQPGDSPSDRGPQLPEWPVETYVGAEATKDRLTELLAGDFAPTLLFTAGHGLGFPAGHERQRALQGALLCQDWPGAGVISPDSYFSAADVPVDADLRGMVAVHFSSYSLGVPRLDPQGRYIPGQAVEVAPQAFVARLPQRLLAQGAAAVVGLVGRVWGYSFTGRRAGELATFESSLRRLLEGHPVGHAFDYFQARHAELAVTLSSQLEEHRFGAQVDDRQLASLTTARADARNLAILGDPAVRLPVAWA